MYSGTETAVINAINMVFGACDSWEKAANVDVNYLCNQFLRVQKQSDQVRSAIRRNV